MHPEGVSDTQKRVHQLGTSVIHSVEVVFFFGRSEAPTLRPIRNPAVSFPGPPLVEFPAIPLPSGGPGTPPSPRGRGGAARVAVRVMEFIVTCASHWKEPELAAILPVGGGGEGGSTGHSFQCAFSLSTEAHFISKPGGGGGHQGTNQPPHRACGASMEMAPFWSESLAFA